jgi:hypothetical protein
MEHMEVLGSDRQHVGTVDRIEKDQIMLTKSDPASGGEHHLIPLDLVSRVDSDKVILSETAAEARGQWNDEDSTRDLSDSGGGI